MHGVCKHVKAARESAGRAGCKGGGRSGSKTYESKLKKALASVRRGKDKGVDAVKLSERFGEDAINELKRRGDIMEKGGWIRML